MIQDCTSSWHYMKSSQTKDYLPSPAYNTDVQHSKLKGKSNVSQDFHLFSSHSQEYVNGLKIYKGAYKIF